MRMFKRKKTSYIDFGYKGKRISRAVAPDKKMAEPVLRDTQVLIDLPSRGNSVWVFPETN